MAEEKAERIAKVLARAGLCSRREAERWIADGRVAVNKKVLQTPAFTVTSKDRIVVDGKLLPEAEQTKLWRYHKPTGMLTSHGDPRGRDTVFAALPAELGRVISVGRLDYNSEGLLLLTNDGGLARKLEMPATGWLRRYRVRVHGRVDEAKLEGLVKGVEIEGIRYGSVQAHLDKVQRANAWLTVALREGKNREVRKIMEHLGLDVNRLIRTAYGPFQLGNLASGEVSQVPAKAMREQLGINQGDVEAPQKKKPVEKRRRTRE
jgi:23S rRNA pseudouridine2605 synthase